MIAEVSEAIRQLLMTALYPDFISDKDRVQLCVPKQKQQDYQIGIYLYDLDSDCLNEKRYATAQGNAWHFPDKLIKASYLIYVNEEEQFGGFSKAQEEQLLEAIIQVFHDTAILYVEDQALPLQFEQPAIDTKLCLWQSFQQPLQPALYINVASIAIASKRKETMKQVKEVVLHTERVK